MTSEKIGKDLNKSMMNTNNLFKRTILFWNIKLHNHSKEPKQYRFQTSMGGALKLLIKGKINQKNRYKIQQKTSLSHSFLISLLN